MQDRLAHLELCFFKGISHLPVEPLHEGLEGVTRGRVVRALAFGERLAVHLFLRGPSPIIIHVLLCNLLEPLEGAPRVPMREGCDSGMAQALCTVQTLACVCRTWLAALIRPRSPGVTPSSRAPLPDFADVALLAQNLGFRDGFEELGEPLRVIKCKAHCENVCSLRSSHVTYSPPKPHSPLYSPNSP